jgi:hypothetical protein
MALLLRRFHRVLFGGAPAIPQPSMLLLEDGSDLLMEDGSRFLLEI